MLDCNFAITNPDIFAIRSWGKNQTFADPEFTSKLSRSPTLLEPRRENAIMVCNSDLFRCSSFLNADYTKTNGVELLMQPDRPKSGCSNFLVFVVQCESIICGNFEIILNML